MFYHPSDHFDAFFGVRHIYSVKGFFFVDFFSFGVVDESASDSSEGLIVHPFFCGLIYSFARRQGKDVLKFRIQAHVSFGEILSHIWKIAGFVDVVREETVGVCFHGCKR